jgi:hypothetical protein
MGDRAAGTGDAVTAPHCEVGCAFTILKLLGADPEPEVAGSEWTFECGTRRLTTFPQPYLDRTDFGVTAQRDGWQDGALAVCGVEVAEGVCERAGYMGRVRDAFAAGGVMLLVDDFHVPWLDYSKSSHGLLPHALAVMEDRPAGRELVVAEGHTWWGGTYTMTYDDLLLAAFPDEDVHGISGRIVVFRRHGEPRPRAERERAALGRLLRTCSRHVAGYASTDAGAAGTLTVTGGRDAGDHAAAALTGFRYVCRLFEDGPGDQLRDAEIGRYTFLRLVDDVAFTVYSRAASARLLRDAGHDAAARHAEAVRDVWKGAWRNASKLAAAPAVAVLDGVVADLRRGVDADVDGAAGVAAALESALY